MFDFTLESIKVVWSRLQVGLCAVLLVGGAVSLLPHSTQAQQVLPKISFPIQVSTPAGDIQRLTLGFDSSATEGIDEALGETEQPPLPPSSIFDARLVGDGIPVSELGLGTVTDIRPGPEGFSGTKVHRIQVQPGPEKDSISFSWTLPDGIKGKIKDAANAVYGPVQMEGHGSLTVGAQAPDAIVTLDYSGSQEAVNVQTGTFGESDRLEFPGTGVILELSGTVDPGTVLIRRLGSAPENPAGIVEENVSGYRYVIEEQNSLNFDRAEVKLVAATLPGVEDPNAIRAYRREEPNTGTFAALKTTVRENGTPGDFSDDTLSVLTEGLGEFALGSDTEPLPVELIHLEATIRNENTVRLVWKTVSETRNAGFRIQWKSHESAEWKQIGYVESEASGGTTAKPQFYQYSVEDLQAGTHQFRLKQMDLSGAFTLTEPVAVNVQMQEALKLSSPVPNPVSTTAMLSFAAEERSRATVFLFNEIGQKVAMLHRSVLRAGEQHTIQINVGSLPSGTYFLRLRSNDETRVRQMTVIR
jgi:hypothetical protein